MNLIKKCLTVVLILGAGLALNAAKDGNANLHNVLHQLKIDTGRISKELFKAKNLNPFRVTFFGASRISQDHPASQAAYKLAQQLVQADISIITGGGPGIMQAGNCGAASIKSNKINSLGVVQPKVMVNECIQRQIQFASFATRKNVLMQLSNAYVFFPGGYGTLEELGEVLSLIQDKELAPGPVILFGKDYWQPLMHWFKEQVFPEKLVAPEYQGLITVTDSLEEAQQIILKHKKKMQVYRPERGSETLTKRPSRV